MKIMVAYDGSAVSKRALDLAQKHALAFGDSKIFIVTFLNVGMYAQQNMLGEQERELSGAMMACIDNQIDCEIEVLSHGGSAGEALVDFAEKNSMDEIIIGVKKRSKVGKLFFGSTAQFIILSSKCPVVTIH